MDPYGPSYTGSWDGKCETAKIRGNYSSERHNISALIARNRQNLRLRCGLRCGEWAAAQRGLDKWRC
jgi:hypothetical protein